jgi:hypothetical protein
MRRPIADSRVIIGASSFASSTMNFRQLRYVRMVVEQGSRARVTGVTPVVTSLNDRETCRGRIISFFFARASAISLFRLNPLESFFQSLL